MGCAIGPDRAFPLSGLPTHNTIDEYSNFLAGVIPMSQVLIESRDGNLDAVKCLIDHMAVNVYGSTALHWAASMGHAAIVEILERAAENTPNSPAM